MALRRPFGGPTAFRSEKGGRARQCTHTAGRLQGASPLFDVARTGCRLYHSPVLQADSLRLNAASITGTHLPKHLPLILSSSLIDERAGRNIPYKLILVSSIQISPKYLNAIIIIVPFIGLPRKRIFLRDRLIVVQFHLRFLNWC